MSSMSSTRPRSASHMTAAPLIIIGTGGFARETADVIAGTPATPGAESTWDLIGYLDDDPTTHGRIVHGAKVLGPIEAIADHPDTSVVVCVGNPGNYFSRARVVARLGLAHERYATVVHPAASVGPSVRIGRGVVIHAGAVMTADVTIGDHVAIMPNVVLTHDDRIADLVTFGSGALVAGAVEIARGAYIGAGAMIREGVHVGAWSLLGMGSVVTHDVPAGEQWMGVPARRHAMVDVPADLAGG